MIKAALIDVGGTLWPDQWPAAARPLCVKRLKDSFGLSSVEIHVVLAALEERNPASLLVQDPLRMATEALAVADLQDIAAQDLLAALDVPATEVVELFPGAAQMLQELSLGLQCIVISNTTYRSAKSYRRDFREMAIDDFIDHVVTSFDVGFRKPSAEIFRAAIDAAGISYDQCVMIGDSEHADIEPAKTFGMPRAILVCIETLATESRADVIVQSLTEIPDIVRDWVNE